MLCVPCFKVIDSTGEIGIALPEESGLQVFPARGRGRLSVNFLIVRRYYMDRRIHSGFSD
jgi:hypothetical protein